MIVNTCQLEGERDGLSKLLQQPSHVRLDSIETLNLLVIIHEHIRVYLVNEDFVPDVLLDHARLLNDLEELLASALVVRPVRVNDIDESATVLYVLNGVTLEHIVPGEIDHVELDIVVVAHGLRLNIARGQQEKCLVRRHLLENNFTDARLTRSINGWNQKVLLRQFVKNKKTTYLGIPMRQMFMSDS